MCLAVGIGETVYHPINSSDGNTCLSFLERQGVTSDRGLLRRTLVSPVREERVIN